MENVMKKIANSGVKCEFKGRIIYDIALHFIDKNNIMVAIF